MYLQKYRQYERDVYFWRSYILRLQAWAIKKVNDKNKLVERRCPVCGTENEKTVLKAPVYDFVLCETCGLVYAKYVLNDHDIDKFYRNNEIYQSAWKKLAKNYESIVKGGRLVHNSIVKTILDYKKNNERSLDIGCAFGELLYELKPFFKNVEGVELNEEMSKLGRKIFGVRIHQNRLEELRLPSSSYDVVILNQVIEHLNNLDSLFKEIYRILRLGGIVYISLPNMDSLSMKLFKGKHTHVCSHGHINMFNKESLLFLAKKHGFAAKKIETRNLDITLIDIIYHLIPRKFVHRYSYNIILTPISLFVGKILDYGLDKSNLLQKWEKGSYLEAIFEK